MIDLNRNRAQMLAGIAAGEAARRSPLLDPEDPAFLSLDPACLLLRGHSREELLPGLRTALERRFPHVSKDRLDADLLDLLKKGLGNAYKRGNEKDHGKWITVEVLATREEALISISDEGAGFEVEAIVGRFRTDERYFENKGSGLSRFEKSRSLVWWEHAGRTLVIGFRCRPEPGRLTNARSDSGLGVAGDEQALCALFAAEVPFFRRNRLRLESCRAYVAAKGSSDASEIRYIAEYRGASGESRSVSMVARLLPRAAAEADFRIAHALHRGMVRERAGMRVPKPLAVLRDPSMVLYRFEPDQTLRERVKPITRFQDLATLIRNVATGLVVLHTSVLPVDLEEGVEAELERHRSTGARLEERLGGSGRAAHLSRCVNRSEARAASLGAWERVPVHGAFGWDSVVCDGRGKLHLRHFDQCRRSHPGLDLGGFLADLLRFYVVRDQGDPGFYAAGRDVFLDAYFGDRPPFRRDQMDWFMACALFRRLDRLLARPEGKWEPKVDALLEQLERTLC